MMDGPLASSLVAGAISASRGDVILRVVVSYRVISTATSQIRADNNFKNT
jgi:hypothetical protein